MRPLIISVDGPRDLGRSSIVCISWESSESRLVSIGYRPRVSAVTVESFSLGVYSSSSSSSILISLRVVYANEFSTPIRVIRSAGIIVCVKLRSARLNRISSQSVRSNRGEFLPWRISPLACTHSSSSSFSMLISLRVVYANEFSTPIRVIRSSEIIVCVKLRSAIPPWILGSPCTTDSYICM